MKSLTHQVIRGAFWQILLKLSLILLRIVFLGVISRLLTENDFGIIQAVTTIVFLVTQLGMLGLGKALIQRQAVDVRHVSVAFWSFVMLGLGISLILLVGANPIASLMKIPELKDVLHVIFLLPLVLSLGALSRHLLMKEMEFKRLALYEFIAFVIGYFVVGLVLALNGFGYWALVGAVCGEAVVATAIVYVFNPIQVKFYFDKRIFKLLFSYGGLDTGAQVAGLFGNKLDTFFINAGFGTSVLGLYNRAASLTNTNINLVSEVIDKVFFSAFSKKKDTEGQINGFMRANYVLALVSIPFTAFCVFSARELVLIILGNNWESVVSLFVILCISIPFRLLNKVGLQLLRAQGVMKKVLYNQLSYLIISIILMVSLYRYDLLFFISSITLSYIVLYLLTLYNVMTSNPGFRFWGLISDLKFTFGISFLYFIGFYFVEFKSFDIWISLLIKSVVIVVLFSVNFFDPKFKGLLKSIRKVTK